jgi:hypothetical protein
MLQQDARVQANHKKKRRKVSFGDDGSTLLYPLHYLAGPFTVP